MFGYVVGKSYVIFPFIPKSAKALKQTFEVLPINAMGDHGEYIHFDNWIIKSSRTFISSSLPAVKEFNLAINIDGISNYIN